MPEPKQPVDWYTIAFAWINAAIFLFAAMWGTFEAPNQVPMAGLRQVSANLWVAWPLALGLCGIAIEVSVERFRTRDRLLLTAGALVCGWLVMALYVAPGPAVGLAGLAALIYRQTKATA
jgi:hypothetical protein